MEDVNMLSAYSKFLDKLEKTVGWMSIILMFVGFAVIFAQTIARYFFHTGAAWMEEVGRYAIIYLSFLCAPIAIRHGKHMAIDVLEARFAPLPRTLLHIAFDILLLWFFGVMTYSGVVYT
jgi:TRAP-type C4-dicarboxylate transport system permease small subunit